MVRELFLDYVSKGNHKLFFVARVRKYQMYSDDNLAVETYNVSPTVHIKLIYKAFITLQNECFIIMETNMLILILFSQMKYDQYIK